ncbi:MAG TPA: carboxypeptidase-like regulatory domain-containing protein, partial [Balneolales bacterium]|nr:carboxypeptidase-like regulatory domain-containing protein [Balneolales bacterium]
MKKAIGIVVIFLVLFSTSSSIAKSISFDGMRFRKVVKKNDDISYINKALNKKDLKVSGKVTDASNGKALPGVDVLVKGTTIGTATNSNGMYTLNVPSSTDTLVVSYIGYKTKVIPVRGRSTINVSLQTKAVLGGQLVVVGYSTQRKQTLTGSVSEVKGSSLSEAPVANITHSIAGKIAGVSMSTSSGQPGQNNPTINIRGIATTGNSQPLIVVNGIKRNNLNEIDPNTIKSITVLKDAAAVAPYGMGGANGVILITTKTGQTGKPQLSFNTYYGISTPTYYPHMLNAQDFMRLSNEAYLNSNPNGSNPPFAKDLIANYAQLNAKNPNKYPITNNAGKQYENLYPPRAKSSLQLSGGAHGITYYAELGFTNQDGMFYNVNYRRYDYNVHVDAQA